jgi:hypothetical protein
LIGISMVAAAPARHITERSQRDQAARAADHSSGYCTSIAQRLRAMRTNVFSGVSDDGLEHSYAGAGVKGVD